KMQAHCASLVERLIKHIGPPFVFDPVPGLMRSYERMGSRHLARNGSNISPVLLGLKQKQEDGGGSHGISRILSRLRRLPSEPYREMTFVKTLLNDVIFGLVENTTGRLVDARLLSDGTLRTLAILTLLESETRNSRIIIEGFDSGLHPACVRVLTEALQESCGEQALNVLVSTHNPAVLDALDATRMDGVMLSLWDKSIGAFNLTKLSGLCDYEEFLRSGRIGELCLA
ncbi:AAA family ATPase, partial [Thermodesulfobacteriota bacterium]